MGRISLIEGDITEQLVDVIVNAANTDLLLGAGVAGAIRDRGGASIQAECDQRAPIPLGDAVVTGAGDLPATWIVHAAVMPLGGSASEQSVLDCVRSSLEIADAQDARTIAIPALGTGVGGFSMQRCAEISLEQARQHLAGPSQLEEVRFVLFGEPAYRLFEMVNDADKVAAQMEKLGRR